MRGRRVPIVGARSGFGRCAVAKVVFRLTQIGVIGMGSVQIALPLRKAAWLRLSTDRPLRRSKLSLCFADASVGPPDSSVGAQS